MVDRAEEVKVSNCDEYKYQRDSSSQSSAELAINNPYSLTNPTTNILRTVFSR